MKAARRGRRTVTRRGFSPGNFIKISDSFTLLNEGESERREHTPNFVILLKLTVATGPERVHGDSSLNYRLD